MGALIYVGMKGTETARKLIFWLGKIAIAVSLRIKSDRPLYEMFNWECY
jgi:hypothetical protein